ncbi:dehydrogenase [Nocardiopsis dassonvillei]|uniref:dehydrogenase n=1 Tax=Nocardiopsis dassonvillei TaxID=2014 RepID=UPI00363A6EB0
MPTDVDSVVDVHPFSHGAVVEMETGLVGLSGDTGQEIWSYRVPGADSFDADLSADAGHAVVRHATGQGEFTTILLDTVTGEVAENDVAWDGKTELINAERQLRRDSGDEGLLLEVADLFSGQSLWEQTEPVTCEGGGPSRQVRADTHAEAIVVLAYCADDVSEDALYSPEQPATHALVALDPGTGAELWRHESTEDDTEGFSPEAEVVRFGGTLAVRFPGIREELLFDMAEGTLVAESPGTVLDVTETGFLAQMREEGGGFVHEFRGFDGEVVASVPLPEDFRGTIGRDDTVLLDEAMVWVQMERGTDGDVIDAGVTAWNGGEATVIGTGVVTESASTLEPGRLLRVPGAVLVYVPVRPEGPEAIEKIVALR